MILLLLKRICFLFFDAKQFLPSAKQTKKVSNYSALSEGCFT